MKRYSCYLLVAMLAFLLLPGCAAQHHEKRNAIRQEMETLWSENQAFLDDAAQTLLSRAQEQDEGMLVLSRQGEAYFIAGDGMEQVPAEDSLRPVIQRVFSIFPDGSSVLADPDANVVRFVRGDDLGENAYLTTELWYVPAGETEEDDGAGWLSERWKITTTFGV